MIWLAVIALAGLGLVLPYVRASFARAVGDGVHHALLEVADELDRLAVQPRHDDGTPNTIGAEASVLAMLLRQHAATIVQEDQ